MLEIFKNKQKINYISLQQFSVNSDILEFHLKKVNNISFENCEVEIIFETDKLSRLKNDNINILEDEEIIKVTWKISGSLTYTSGIKKAQIVIKKDNVVYLSKVFQITVLESLQVDNEIMETNLNYLEYWEDRINELANKVENGVNLSFEDLTDEQKESLKGEPGEVDIKILESYQPKISENLETNSKEVVFAINEINELAKQKDNNIINLEQKILLNVESNNIYNIGLKNNNNRVIIQAFKFLEGKKDIVQTIKNFRNSEEDNFYYDKNNIIFNDDGCSIKNSFDLEITNNNGLFESSIIEKDEFLKLEFESIGLGVTDISPRMTSNTTPAPYKVISNSEYGGSWQAWNAFDGIEGKTSDTGWVTNSSNHTTIPYITIDFGKEINFTEIWLGCYRYNSNHATKATIFYSQDNSTFIKLGTYSLNYSDDIYEKIKFDNRIFARYIKIQIDSRYNSKTYTGFSEIKIFDNKQVNYLIKKDDIYYTIENNLLKQIETEINDEVIINNGIKLADINENINNLPNNFSFISNEEYQLTIKGLKENKELVVAKSDFSSIIQDNIDYFECKALQSGNGQIKIAFSLDSGKSWKSYKDGDFVDLDCNIPLKEYDLLTDEELNLFNNAKQKIYENGINYSELKSIDFNILNFKKIRFAYILNVENINDVAINKELIWQFDSKGSLKQLKDAEFDLELKESNVEFKSLINSNMIKVNIFSD